MAVAQDVTELVASGARILHGTLAAVAPADSVEAGAAWPAGWSEIGFTSEPTVIGREVEEVEFVVEQSINEVKRQLSSEKFTIETKMAQLNMELLELAWNGTVTPTAGGPAQKAKDELEFGGEAVLAEEQWGIEGVTPDSTGTLQPIRIIFFKATARLGGELNFAKGEATGIPLTIKPVADMSKDEGKRIGIVTHITGPTVP